MWAASRSDVGRKWPTGHEFETPDLHNNALFSKPLSYTRCGLNHDQALPALLRLEYVHSGLV